VSWSRSTAAAPSVDAGSLAALRQALPIVLFGALPVAVVVTMFVVGEVSGPLALDFRQELYPQANELLDGRNPYPEGIWPPISMLAVMPLAILPASTANIAIGVIGLACMALALCLVGLRDWRVYGLVALWPQVLGDIRIAHLTPLLCLLAAVVWRYRDRPLVAGAGLGIAGGVKFFLWPLGVWLLATGRARAAVIGAVIATASVLLVAPFAPLDDYLRTLRDVSRTFDQDSYSLFALLTQLGASDLAARAMGLVLGGALLILTWRLKSFALAIAAALALSPIVWFDFYALAAVPLAIARPRLSLVWFLPLITWGLPSSGIATDPVWGVGRVLLVFAVVLLAAARSEHAGSHAGLAATRGSSPAPFPLHSIAGLQRP
jgi:Glycosyltransferase family 87